MEIGLSPCPPDMERALLKMHRFLMELDKIQYAFLATKVDEISIESKGRDPIGHRFLRIGSCFLDSLSDFL